jgi:hypothetical protein
MAKKIKKKLKLAVFGVRVDALLIDLIGHEKAQEIHHE